MTSNCLILYAVLYLIHSNSYPMWKIFVQDRGLKLLFQFWIVSCLSKGISSSHFNVDSPIHYQLVIILDYPLGAHSYFYASITKPWNIFLILEFQCYRTIFLFNVKLLMDIQSRQLQPDFFDMRQLGVVLPFLM